MSLLTNECWLGRHPFCPCQYARCDCGCVCHATEVDVDWDAEAEAL